MSCVTAMRHAYRSDFVVLVFVVILDYVLDRIQSIDYELFIGLVFFVSFMSSACRGRPRPRT